MFRPALIPVAIAVLVAVFFSTGAQWMVVQTIGWANMVVTYSRGDATLGEALRKTFDGEHPCNLCHSVRDADTGSKTGDAAPSSAPALSIAGILPPAGVRLRAPGFMVYHYPVLVQEAALRPGLPRLQPPRVRVG